MGITENIRFAIKVEEKYIQNSCSHTSHRTDFHEIFVDVIVSSCHCVAYFREI
jgi:hypothetical protein